MLTLALLTVGTTASAWLQILSQLALEAAPIVIIPAILWLLRHGVAWLQAHTRNTTVQGILGKAEGLAEVVVRSRTQQFVNALKVAAEDGKITADELKAALAEQKKGAEADLKGLLTESGLAQMRDTLGLDSATQAKLLGDLIEAVLHKVKLEAGRGKADGGAAGPLAP